MKQPRQKKKNNKKIASKITKINIKNIKHPRKVSCRFFLFDK